MANFLGIFFLNFESIEFAIQIFLNSQQCQISRPKGRCEQKDVIIVQRLFKDWHWYSFS
jgi:hypothetical protein